jgi:hypothetical protein
VEYNPLPLDSADSRQPGTGRDLWLMPPDDDQKERFAVLVAGCGCKKVCNALTDFDEDKPHPA